MLKGIPKIISPELLKALSEMGHGDTLVIADGNFPAESIGKNAIVIRYDAIGVTPLLKAILELFPLDTYVQKPVSLMEVVAGDTVETPIWEEYKTCIRQVDARGDEAVENIKRETRRYAKRQLTWFKREENTVWLYVDDYMNSDELVAEAIKLAREHFEK